MLSKTKKVVATIVLFSSAACTTMQPVAEPAQFFAKNNPRFVVVTTTTQDEEEPPLVLNRPRFEEGTLLGLVQGEATSIPVTQVRTIAANQVNRKRTTVFLGVGAVVVGTIVYLAATSGDGYSDYYCEPPCRGAPETLKPSHPAF
jgi:hypothetical protein